LNLKINSGETVALVGESGCGKTTTLQLLQRFYEIESGEILIDGVNIRTISPYNLRTHISAVPQTPVLFSMSIKDNISYGKATADEQEISEAAQIGNAHNFIMNLPQNYSTIVQQTSLSGGQKQRICISRAILANTPVLLLDEATAAIDIESEQLVQESLEKFRKGKTALVVAHRLATVLNADRIFVFANGRVVEEGTHPSLLEKKWNLCRFSQFPTSINHLSFSIQILS
jgi:ABC-type multidrug transport system fused ATPase/permease subunit